MTGRQTDNRAPSIRIAAHYRDKILSGELQPGELIPSIKALAKEWEVAQATVSKAIDKLRHENLVRGIHGVGTEVIGPPAPLSTGTQRQERGQRTGSSWGTGERADSHSANLLEAPAPIAAALGLQPGAEVIRRTRVYRDAHGVVAHSTSWLPGEFAQAMPELLRAQRLSNGTSLDLVARTTGHRAVRRIEATTARIATEEDLALLELPARTTAAILVLSARFLDEQDRAIEYGVDIGAPGRTRLDESDIP